MRMLMEFTFPVDAGNDAIKEGRIGKVLQALLETTKAEAAYFHTPGGDRGGFIVFDMKDPSDIPAIAEPLFMELGAQMSFHPVMTADDVRAGLKKAGF
jgi:hypothetical protein